MNHQQVKTGETRKTKCVKIRERILAIILRQVRRWQVVVSSCTSIVAKKGEKEIKRKTKGTSVFYNV